MIARDGCGTTGLVPQVPSGMKLSCGPQAVC